MQIEQFYCQSRCFRIVAINPHTYRLRWQTRLGIKYRLCPYNTSRCTDPSDIESRLGLNIHYGGQSQRVL